MSTSEARAPSPAAGAAARLQGTVAVDLRGLEQLGTAAVALFVALGQSAPTELAALIDWRLCGLLTHAIVDGHCTGALGEQLLLPSSSRLGHMRVFVFGLGDPQALGDAQLAGLLARASAAAAGAGVRHLDLVAPSALDAERFARAVAAARTGGLPLGRVLVERAGPAT